MKKKRKIKLKWKNIIILCVLLLSCGGIIATGIQMVDYFASLNRTNKIIEQLEEKSYLYEKPEEEEYIPVNPPKDPENPYYDYIKMPFLGVDFEELKKINSDIVGWLQLANTSINYPFVQTADNDFYLTHSLDKKRNSAGWVFLDYRNDLSKDEKHTILYAHGRYDGTMFGSLFTTLKDSWYQNKENHIIKYATEDSTSLWQIFSVYKIPNTSDYLKIKFSTDEKYLEFLEKLQNRSIYNFEADLTKEDKIITLSTCYDDYNKMVVHAKLIKKNNN